MKHFPAGPYAPSARCVRLAPYGVCRALIVALFLLVGAGSAAAQSPVPNGLNQLAQTLALEGTYVSPRLAAEVTVADEARLQRQLDAASLRGVTLRLAVLDQVPVPYRALEDFAAALYAAMQLPDSILVVATPHGVAARTDAVPSAEIAQEIANARPVFERDGYLRALEAVADGLVADALALGTPAAAAPAAAPAQSPDRVFERRGGVGLSGLPVALLIVLGLVVAGCLWLARRLWQQQLARVLAARQLAQDRLAAADGDAHRRAIEAARRSVADGTQALQAMQSLPWWQKWLVPWAPPPQLRLADHAFLTAAQALGDVAASGADIAGDASPSAHHRTRAASPAARPPDAPPPVQATGSPGSPAAGTGLTADGQPGSVGESVAAPGQSASLTAKLAAPTAEPESRPRTRRRWGWLTRQPESTLPAAPGSLAPEHVLAGLQPKAPLACFFCGCPLTPALAQVGTVALAGAPLRPLLCARHAAALASDERPAVRARTMEEDTLVPWFRDDSYSPDWDFDPNVPEPTLGWDVLPPPDQLLSGSLRAVVHADDPRWATAESRP